MAAASISETIPFTLFFGLPSSSSAASLVRGLVHFSISSVVHVLLGGTPPAGARLFPGGGGTARRFGPIPEIR